MNKREFLRDLERRLSILDEQEVRDIINEYEDIIDEKIKDGKSETDAVNEFGRLEELSSEILKAYKINPKYCNSNTTTGRDKAKEVVISFEKWIKYASGEMAKFLKNAGDVLSKSGRIPNLELVLEIVIKIVILLTVLAILRIPFYIIGGLWVGTSSFLFTPVDWIFAVLWKILSLVVYLAAAVCIFLAMFREYFTEFSSTDKSAGANGGAELKAEITREEKVAATDKLSPKEPLKKGNSGGVTGVLLTLVRVFVIIVVLIPLWLAQAGLIVAMFIAFYYFFDGVNILGLTIILAGAIAGVAGLSDLIYKLAFKIKKLSLLCIIPFIISTILVTTGAFVFAHNILGFEYVDGLPENIKYTAIEKTFNLEDEKRIITPGFANVEYEIDEKLINGEVVVLMSYIDETGKINDIKMTDRKSHYFLTITYERLRLYDLRMLYDLLINDLKNSRVYNYSNLNKPGVVLKANAVTMNAIKGGK